MTEEKILSALESEKLVPSEQSLAEFYQANEDRSVSAAVVA